MSKKIKCYNCGRECEVTKCSCGAEDWTCENCRVGIGHLCNILNGKKERYCIKNGKLYDRDVCVGYISEYQDETYVDMLNYLDEQLVEKDKEIEKIRKEATEEIEFLHKQYDRCDRARKKAINQLAEKDKEIESLRKEFSSRLRLIRHPICEEIRRFIRQPENSIFYDVSLYVETAGLEKLLDKLEKGE